MMFRHPALLVLVATVPALWWTLRRLRDARRDTVIAFTGAELAAELASTVTPRRLPPVLFSLALLCTVAAVAAPSVTTTGLEQSATVVLVIDTSTSMLADDVAPDRLSAAKQAAMAFARKVPEDWRIALVGFSAEANVAAPPTRERVRILESLAALVPSNGTATGDAIDLAIDVGRAGSVERLEQARTERDTLIDPSRSLIVLLSDGAQTAGEVQWRDAAQRAARLGIPVYTVALGTPGGMIDIVGANGPQTVNVPPDAAAMNEIARIADAVSFAADDLETLTAAYDNVSTKLETTEKLWDLTPWAAGTAALLALAGLATSLRRR
jgi:Ca-activated chloride channel family protein